MVLDSSFARKVEVISASDEVWLEEVRKRTDVSLGPAAVNEDRVQVYKEGKLVRHGDVTLVVDRFGSVNFAMSAYLQSLKDNGLEEITVHQYGRKLNIFNRSLDQFDNWKGLPLSHVDDDYISAFRDVRTSIWKTGPKTLAEDCKVILRCIEYAQSNGWCGRLIGKNTDEVAYPISLPDGTVSSHPATKCKGMSREYPVMPTAEDLRLVQNEFIELPRSEELQKRNTVIVRLHQRHPFRRREVVEFPVDSVPGRTALERKREEHVLNQSLPGTLPISVKRAKQRHFWAEEQFAISELIELRDYADEERDFLLKDNGARALILSSRSGASLNPQSITNMWGKAAHRAADRAEKEGTRTEFDFDLRKVHGHHHRHREITDRFLAYLRHGMDGVDALILVMQMSGIKSVDTAFHYLHLAETIFAMHSPAAVAVSRELEAAACKKAEETQEKAYNKFRQDNRIKELFRGRRRKR